MPWEDLETILNENGSERIVYGTDLPTDTCFYPLEFVVKRYFRNLEELKVTFCIKVLHKIGLENPQIVYGPMRRAKR